jgi:hypothetical protein
MTLDRFP